MCPTRGLGRGHIPTVNNLTDWICVLLNVYMKKVKWCSLVAMATNQSAQMETCGNIQDFFVNKHQVCLRVIEPRDAWN